MSIRIVATSDNHLGRYYARMPVMTLDKRRWRLRHAFGQVIDYAIANHAHLLVLAGDVFDTPNPRNPDRIYLAKRLRDLERAGVRVVAVGGNHDAPRSATEEGGYLPLAVYAELDALTFFDQLLPEDPVVRPVVFEIEGLKVAVGGFTPNVNLGPEHDPLENVTFDGQGADVRVLVIHAPIEGTVYPDANTVVVHRLALERLKEVDLVIVGNAHRFTSFAVDSKRVVIPGSTEWMDYGDLGVVKPGFAVIEARSRAEVTVRHEDVPPQPRAEVVVQASELESGDPTEIILARLAPESDPDKLVRLAIDGVIARDVYTRLNLTTVEDHARRLFFFFETDLTRLAVRFSMAGRVTGSPRRSIRDEVNAVVSHYVTQTVDPTERKVLEATRQGLLSTLEALHEA
jgi:exonuclease SbcD